MSTSERDEGATKVQLSDSNNPEPVTAGVATSVSSRDAASGTGAPPGAASTDAAAATAAASPEPALSKNAKKRIARWERKMEQRRKKKQQEKDIRLAKAKAQGRDLEEERRRLQQRTEEGTAKRRRIQQFVEQKLPLAQQSYQVCVDCGFEVQMTEREVGSLAKQLRYCYASNRKTPHPCLLSVTSLGGSTLRNLQNVSGYDEWATYAFRPTADPLEVHFKDRLKDVVYLTSDAETTIDHLDDSKIYVIGGIVDRNRLRGATLERAKALGVATAKLPLSEHMKAMPTTPVLTVNHVFELLLKYRERGRDWRMAMEDVIPHRKQAEFDEKKDAERAAQVDCESSSP
jgi:tRNA (guanine9-N1)-methyltransferase